MTAAALLFRRICSRCRRPVDWRPRPLTSHPVADVDWDWDGEFFHLLDRTRLCEGAGVEVETREQTGAMEESQMKKKSEKEPAK
jgi:hypothetical protein